MKWRAYPKYRDSGIEWLGEIPEHWEIRKLKHVATIQFSNVDKNTVEDEETVRLCNYVDVYYNDFITAELEFMEATATVGEIRKFMLRDGDVLVTKDSESWDDIAVPACVVGNHDKILCGYHLAQIRPNPTQLDGKYLFRCFRAGGINDQFRVAATGITRYGLGKYWIDNGLFPIPPIDEQRAIAAFLNRKTARIDALIEKKERQIELLQEKRAAVISHAVTKGLDPNVKMKDSGIEWLGDIPEHWEIKSVKYIGQFYTGWTPPTGRDEYFIGDNLWANISDLGPKILEDTAKRISNEAIKEARLKISPKGSLLFSFKLSIGQVSIAGADMYTNEAIATFPPDNGTDVAYLYWAAPFYIPHNADENIYGAKLLNQDLIKNARMAVPPEDEQRAIAAFLDEETGRIDALIEKIRKSIDLLREYRTALITAAVTGKIDVRDLPAPQSESARQAGEVA